MTARLIAIDGAGRPEFVDELRGVWDAGNAAFVVDPRLPPAMRDDVIAEMRVGEPVERGDALVVASSGTTGTPKGIVLTHAAVEASAQATSERLGITSDDHWLACLPLAHVGGLSVVTRALSLGTQLTVLPRPDPAEIDASPATRVSLVATVLPRIDTTRWRTIVLGGSRPPADRPPNSVTTYGMTETGSGVVYDGVPLDGVDVRIDEAGEIHLRGPMLLRCYRDGTDPKDADGWLPTGDLGRWLDDGRLHVEGRRGDLIITGGENVWPEQVERAIADHPSVREVMVYGEPDPEWGQRVVARIVPTDDASPDRDELGRDELSRDELRTFLDGRVPRFMIPKRVETAAELPRTALGKPIRPRT